MLHTEGMIKVILTLYKKTCMYFYPIIFFRALNNECMLGRSLTNECFHQYLKFSFMVRIGHYET